MTMYGDTMEQTDEAIRLADETTKRPGRVIALWAPKGGQGVSTIAAGLAVAIGEAEGACTVVDYGGDLPALFGMVDDPRVGIWDWDAQHYDNEDRVGDLADVVTSGIEMRRLAVEVGSKIRLVPAGDSTDRRRVGSFRVAFDALRAIGGTTVVDLGGVYRDDVDDALAAADLAVMVVVSEYIALRRALHGKAIDLTDAAILLTEPDRSLGLSEMVDVLDLGNKPVVETKRSAILARAVDAGVFAYRCPVAFAVEMRDALKRLNRASEGARMT